MSLSQVLKEKEFCRLLEVHSAIAALVAEQALGSNGEFFDGYWSSSLTDSALRGLPDTEILDQRSRLDWLSHTRPLTGRPIVMDGDTGGRLEHFTHWVRMMEQQGISAVVIEDKTGDKHNSLTGDVSVHTMAPVAEFAQKIAAGVATRASADFLVLARLEGLIVGLPDDEVYRRAEAYLEAGADGLVIHSKQSAPAQVIRFAERVRRAHPEVPLIAIPTTYSQVPESNLRTAGFNVVIYANHMLRASVRAMTEVCRRILDHERALEAEELCVPTMQIIDLHRNSTPVVSA